MKTIQSSTLQRALVAAAAGVAALWPASAYAQVQPPNNPPAGAYQPIPNFSGPGAGLLFRRAINDRFSGAAAISPAIVRLPLASLPPVVDGMVFFCTDCKRANPCATGGTGAWATGARSEWRCAEGPLEANLDAAGKKLTNVGAAVANGDAIAFGQAGAKIGDVADSGATDGSNTISQFSINGIRNVRNWGATGSATTVTATTSASSASITVSAAGDFKVGQGVKISRAGTAASAATPSGLTLDRRSFQLNPDPTGSVDAADTCQTTGWGEGTVQVGNANCTSTRRYAVTAIDAQGGWSAPTATMQLTNAADTLSASNSVYASWSAVSNAIAYGIYTCKGAGCTPTLKAVVPAPLVFYRDASELARYNFAADAEFGGVLQAGAKNKDLYTTITAIAGTTFTLATAPSQSGSFTMRHDDGPAINTLLATMCPATGGEVQIPAGIYPIATTINLASCAGVKVRGSGYPRFGDPAAGVILTWVGGLGGTVINMDRANSVVVENLGIHGNVNTPGIGVDLDRSPGGSGTPTHNTLRHMFVGRSGIGISIARSSLSNNELHTFDDVTLGDEHLTGKGAYIGYYIAGGWQTNNERYYGGSVGLRTFGFYLDCPGHLEMFSPNLSQNVFDFWSACGSGAPSSIVGLHSEESQMFWHGATGAGGGIPLTITASLIGGMSSTLNGYAAYFGGPVVMSGSTVACSGKYPCKVALERGGSLSSVFASNRFDDAVPLIDSLVPGETDKIGYFATGNRVKAASLQPILPEQRGFQNLHATINLSNLGFNQGAINTLKTAVLADPPAPNASVEGTPGSTSATYYLACEDANGGKSIASSGTTITNAPNTLNITDRVRIDVPNETVLNYARCNVLKNGTSGSVLLTTTCPMFGCQAYDTGQILGSYTAPSRNETGDAALAGGLSVGGGALLKKKFASTFSLNLAAPGAVPGCVDSAAQTMTGAALGDVCGASMNVTLQGAQQLGCFVNAAAQVTFRVCQLSGPAADPDGGSGATYRAVVEQY